jgi:hypothetical protein
MKSLSQRVGEPAATIIHVVCGLCIVALYLVFPSLAISLFSLFIIIEVIQVWKKGDQGWPELIQFGVGAASGAAVIAILTVLGVIGEGFCL